MTTSRRRTDVSRLTERERAALVERLASRRPAPSAPERIEPADPDRPVPLSFSQQQIWVLQQIDPADRSYNIVDAVRLHGPLDAGLMRAAIARLTDRHPALRTAFDAPR